METIPLIYPCVLDANQLARITNIRMSISTLLGDFLNHSLIQKTHLKCNLLGALMDLREIESYQNSKGYKYQSYVLQLMLLKLVFITESLISFDNESIIPFIKELNMQGVAIQSIIEETYKAYKEDQI